ncbi:hypothetical protein Cylst_5610 [Cylindrospermum stagnale PCC 7417]|uniref:Uncharacterized protein n=1 Tax=Cylindrospermum stagnale PCC 7417 TaxID=56107 RepID=K9X6C3_9NOST|nr:hypothetical protein [Cylindrospermum stagnale]AFZ27611.1 hypothetical protein Cylst_5610 [Cylindrospermum stagnale PCC 7417]
MAKNSIFANFEFFRNLSEEEQEGLVAGQDSNILGNSNFFFQNTNIETGADSNLNLGGGETGSQSSNYKFSQVTIGSSITLVSPNISSNGNNLSNLISNLVSRLFSSSPK